MAYYIYILILMALSVYFVFRWQHVRKLKADVNKTISLPSGNYLSWTAQDPPVVSPIGSDVDENTSCAAGVLLDRERRSSSVPEAKTQCPEPRDPAGIAAAAFDAAIPSVQSISDLARFDWNVVEGIQHFSARDLDLSEWSNLKEYVNDHYFAVGEPRSFLNRIVGATGEQRAADIFREQGADVLLPETPNNPGYDLEADGTPVQVKVGGGGATIGQHFGKYPDIDVVTGPDNQESISKFGDQISVFDDLEASQVREAVDEGVESIRTDFRTDGSVIPLITSFHSCHREIGLLMQGDTDIKSSLWNAGLDVAGAGLGRWSGVTIGAGLGTGVAPGVGTVIGAIIGGIGGMVAGKNIATKIKYRYLKRTHEEYKRSAESALELIKTEEEKAHTAWATCIQNEQEGLDRFLHQIHERFKKGASRIRKRHRKICNNFVQLFPKILEKASSTLVAQEKDTLAGIRRSLFIRRLIWPATSDVEYRCIKNAFSGKRRRRKKAIASFGHLAQYTPHPVAPVESLRKIRTFLDSNPLEDANLENICRQFQEATSQATTNQKALRQRAAAICRKEYGIRLCRIQQSFRQICDRLASIMSEQSSTVAASKNNFLKEAKKLGLDLEKDAESK